MAESAKARARYFAVSAVNSLGRLIDEMQLTRAEAELGFAYLFAESVPHQVTRADREFVVAQLKEIIAETTEDFAQAELRAGILRLRQH